MTVLYRGVLKCYEDKNFFGPLHLWRFGLVLSIEELRQGPPFYGVNGVVVKPGRVAGYDNVMGLLSHVVLIFFLSLGVVVCSFFISSILTDQLTDKTTVLVSEHMYFR